MGPTVEILIPAIPQHSDRERLDVFAKNLDPSSESADEINVEDTSPIGGSTRVSDGGRPFTANFAEPELEPAEINTIAHEFGFVPRASIRLAAFSNREVDHRILAEMAAHLCEEFGGIVSFGGDLGLRGGSGGRLTELEYLVDGRRCVSHVGDLAFLRQWLIRPEFHLVK